MSCFSHQPLRAFSVAVRLLLSVPPTVGAAPPVPFQIAFPPTARCPDAFIVPKYHRHRMDWGTDITESLEGPGGLSRAQCRQQPKVTTGHHGLENPPSFLCSGDFLVGCLSLRSGTVANVTDFSLPLNACTSSLPASSLQESCSFLLLEVSLSIHTPKPHLN